MIEESNLNAARAEMAKIENKKAEIKTQHYKDMKKYI